MTRNALGKGLSALIREPKPNPEAPTETTFVPKQMVEDREEGVVSSVEIDLIEPSPYQPRSRFENATLEDLASSIRINGILQPLILRRHGSRFQIVAGERRWRAAQRAGLQKVPAILRQVTEQEALEIAIVENLQREDLNPIEQAAAFERLIREFEFTQEEVAKRTGKDRATIANALRLLKLEKEIRALIESRALSAGHGRALLAIEDPTTRMKLAKQAASGTVTVRRIERLATRHTMPAKKRGEALDANTRSAIEDLQRHLGTRVYLRPKSKKRPGQLSIEYYDDKQLMEIYDKLLAI